jgi:hypothetical protein
MMIVDYNTFEAQRFHLSYALRQINTPQGDFVVNGYHKSCRKIWRSVPPPAAEDPR